MAATTNISWCDATWSPIRGCSHASAGCDHCYAERMTARFSDPGLYGHGFAKDGHWTGRVELIESKLDDPLHWRKPKRIFVNSMSDLFHEKLPEKDIARVFGIMSACPQHTFLVLTKRPRRMLEVLTKREFPLVVLAHRIKATCQAAIVGDRITLPLVPLNVHLGVSAEDQATADERIPLLLQTPAAVRFVSIEPMLAPVDLSPMCPEGVEYNYLEREGGLGVNCSKDTETRINWVIAGSETGPGARPFDLDWARSLRDQCQEAGAPFWLKQVGKVAERDRVLDGRTWEERP